MQLMDNNLIVPGGAIIADNTLMKVTPVLPLVHLDVVWVAMLLQLH